MIPTTNTATLGDLIAATAELILETNLKWWFPGQANSEWDLVPTGRRGYTPETERNLANDFMSRARIRYPNHPEADDYAGWVALMQHYGLPTRLLDWSRSPLIAAFFACHGYFPFVIPAHALPEMALTLELAGFRLGDLFPDLQNLATELRGRTPPAA